MLLFCPDDEEEDEPIYHRSPVTLDNGYRPRQQINSNGDLKDEEEGEVDGLDESDDSNTNFEDAACAAEFPKLKPPKHQDSPNKNPSNLPPYF